MSHFEFYVNGVSRFRRTATVAGFDDEEDAWAYLKNRQLRYQRSGKPDPVLGLKVDRSGNDEAFLWYVYGYNHANCTRIAAFADQADTQRYLLDRQHRFESVGERDPLTRYQIREFRICA